MQMNAMLELIRFTTLNLQSYGIFVQTLENIKTVFSFVGENSAIKSFHKCMYNQYRLSKKEAMAKGLGLGMLQIATFCSYSLVIWVGAIAVTGGKAKAGETIAAVINVLSGAM